MRLAHSFAALRAFARDPLYGNGVALVFNSVAGAGIGFLFWVAAARLIAPESLGFGAAIISASTLAALVGKLGFDAAIIRYVPGASHRLARRILAWAAAGSMTLSALAAIVFLAINGHFATALSPLLHPMAAAGFVLLAVGIAAAWVLDAFFIAEQAAVFSLLRNVAFQLVKLATLLVIVGWLAAFAVPLAWGFGIVASLLVALWLVPGRFRRRRVDETQANPTLGELTTYASKNYVLNLSEFLPGLVLPLFVLQWLGPEANARFYIALTIATVGFLASKAVAQSAFAELVRMGPPRDALRKGIRLSALVLLPFLLVLLVAAEFLLAWLGPAYPAAAPVLRVLALAVVPLVGWNMFLAYLKARQAGWELTLLPAASMVTLVGLAPVALALHGLMGLALLWLAVNLAGGIYAVVRLTASFRRTIHEPRTTLHRRAHQG